MRHSQPPDFHPAGQPRATLASAMSRSSDTSADVPGNGRRHGSDAPLPADLIDFFRDNGEQLAILRPFMTFSMPPWDDMTKKLNEILLDAEPDTSEDECHEAPEDASSRGVLIGDGVGTLSLRKGAQVFCMESHDGYGDLYFISLPRLHEHEHGQSTPSAIDDDLFVIKMDTVAFPYTAEVTGPLTWPALKLRYF